MPLPPAAFVFAGPAAAATAKAAAYEYLPAITSASLAALLAKSAWKRIPDWIREDITFQNNNKKLKSSTSYWNGGGGHEGGENLSTVVEKIQAWIAEAASRYDAPEPVPYVFASLLIYWQLCSAHHAHHAARAANNANAQQQLPPLPEPQLQQSPDLRCSISGGGGEKDNNSIGDDGDDDDDTDTATILLLQEMKDMLDLATASYYIDDETHLQTEFLDKHNYKLLKCFIPKRPGFVGYYLAENTQTKTLLIGIKGTTSLEELLTDVCGRSISYHHHHDDSSFAAGGGGCSDHEASLHPSSSCRIEVHAKRQDVVVYEQQQVSHDDEQQGGEEEHEVEIISGHERICIEEDHLLHGGDDDVDDNDHQQQRAANNKAKESHHVRCHEGILRSAQRLLRQIQKDVEHKIAQGYRILLVGHSLGASAASLLAMLIRSKYYRELCCDSDDHHHHHHHIGGSTTSSNSSRRRSRLHAYAFAPPPVMDHDTAVAASQYVTSVVNQSDLFARCSTANVSVLLEFLRTLSEQVLIPNNLAPTGPTSCLNLIQQLSRKVGGGDSSQPPPSLLWTRENMARAMEEAQHKVELRHPDHLYVPGKVYYLQQQQQHQQQQQPEEEIVTTYDIENEEEAVNAEVVVVSNNNNNYTCQLIDATSPALRVIEMNGFQMLGDHTVAQYYAVLDALLLKRQKAKANAEEGVTNY